MRKTDAVEITFKVFLRMEAEIKRGEAFAIAEKGGNYARGIGKTGKLFL